MNERWLDELADQLPRHAAVLRGLLAQVTVDPRWRTFSISCSVADGRGDQLSDLDTALGWGGDPLPADDVVRSALVGVGDLVDCLAHQLPEWGGVTHRRYAAEYADGVQLDLVVLPADDLRGRAPMDVVLYDPDGRLARERRPANLTADAETTHEWLFLGWWALSDAVKYAVRGSRLEAIERLTEVRRAVTRLWAVGEGIRYPVFGHVSLLDAAEPSLPPGLDALVPRLAGTEIRAALRAAPAILDAAAAHAAGRLEERPVVALAVPVRTRVRDLPP